MQRKSILINLVNKNNWRISYCLIRNIYSRHRQLTTSVSTQLHSPCGYPTALFASNLSNQSCPGCTKARNNFCTNTSTRSFHTSTVRLKSEPQNDLNQKDANKSSKLLHNTDKDTDLLDDAFIGDKTLRGESETSVTEAGNKDDDALSVIDDKKLAQVRKMHRGQTVSIFDQILSENPDTVITKDKVLCEDGSNKDMIPSVNQDGIDGAVSGSPYEGINSAQSTSLSSYVSPDSVATQTSIPGKVPIPPLYSVSPVVNESQVLKTLVELGVDVSVYVEKGVAGKLMLMDFERDIQPYVMLLHTAGVQPDQLGTVLTKNPYIFEHDVKHLQVRVDYLLSKRFTREQIGQMLHREAIFICMETKRIDAKLGFYQKEFRLKGAELRDTTARFAKLLTKNVAEFKKNKRYMKQVLGFSDSELRAMFLISPKTYFINMHSVARKFDYLYNEIGFPHELIAHDAWVLNKNFEMLQTRHRFLVKLGRAQYDPRFENYVSLQDLMHQDRNVFCVEVAKASTVEFDDFMKLI